MSHIAIRTVKGAPYYYLDESFKEGKKWVRESVYVGSEKPNALALLKALEALERKCVERSHRVLIPPLTEFITGVAAQKLWNARENKIHLLKQMTISQREEFTLRERIKFITESNAIEGSSLTFEATEEILDQKKLLKKSKKYLITGMGVEEQEALNLGECLDRYDQYLHANYPLSEKMILQLHYILLQKIERTLKYQGIYRPVQVHMRGSLHEFPQHEQVPGLMKRLLDWYHENKNLIHPTELAAKFHTQFTSIHPFADGNGRMARLLMNYILQQKTYPFTNIPLRRRSFYMKTQAAANSGNHQPFVQFLTQEMIKQHVEIKE